MYILSEPTKKSKKKKEKKKKRKNIFFFLLTSLFFQKFSLVCSFTPVFWFKEHLFFFPFSTSILLRIPLLH